MDSLMTATVSEAKEFFRKQLCSVMKKQGLEAEPASVDYIADLLIRNISSEAFFSKDADGSLRENVLAELYMEYVQGTPEKKRIALRRLGDICMMVTGFFSPSLDRKLVDLDYYFGMGGGAYWQLSNLANPRHTYQELSLKFKPFSDVLVEISERSGMQNNTDILRTYERWLSTGSERLRTLLSKHGIEAPIEINTKDRH